MLRKLRPSMGYRFKFCRAVAAPGGVIQRQRLPRSAAGMLRPCSAGMFAVFTTTSGVFAYVKIVGGFNSRRLHWDQFAR